MNTQNEIGDLLYKRLETVQVSSNETIWSSIEATLKERRKKRKMFLWFIGSFIALIAITGIIVFNTHTVQPHTSKTPTAPAQPPQENMMSSTTKETDSVPTKTPFFIIIPDTTHTTVDNKQESKLLKYASKETIQAIKPLTSEQETPAKVIHIETTQTIHTYYNSKDGQEVRSMDKAVIDSTLHANMVKKDSIIPD